MYARLSWIAIGLSGSRSENREKLSAHQRLQLRSPRRPPQPSCATPLVQGHHVLIHDAGAHLAPSGADATTTTEIGGRVPIHNPALY